MEPNRAADRNGDLGYLGGVAAFVGVLLDGSLSIVLDLLFTGAGKAVDQAGNLNHRAVGKDDGGEVHIELSPALHVAGAFHTVHHALHIYARGNHYPVADHHGKSRRQVDAIAELGAPGVDGAAQLEQDFGSGGTV